MGIRGVGYQFQTSASEEQVKEAFHYGFCRKFSFMQRLMSPSAKYRGWGYDGNPPDDARGFDGVIAAAGSGTGWHVLLIEAAGPSYKVAMVDEDGHVVGTNRSSSAFGVGLVKGYADLETSLRSGGHKFDGSKIR